MDVVLYQINLQSVLLLLTQGYGTHFYSDSEYYEGEWYQDKRSGWGRMYYSDGSIYEGEWYDDERSGMGLYRLGGFICILSEISRVFWTFCLANIYFYSQICINTAK